MSGFLETVLPGIVSGAISALVAIGALRESVRLMRVQVERMEARLWKLERGVGRIEGRLCAGLEGTDADAE